MRRKDRFGAITMVQIKSMLFLLVAFHGSLLVLAGEPIANTECGRVRGVRTKAPSSGLNVAIYRGIPFAEPPVGQLRFAKPVPKKPWKGIRDASAFGPACMQTGRKNDEDCLFLNVFAPVDLVANGGPLPVMVYIHGGGFRKGGSSSLDGREIVTRGGVVFVSLNYRLGTLGFLSTGDDAAPGNYGLWDQRLAIQWVKDNIKNFGGNPKQITIFGESAGGFSVSYQAITPRNNRNLFQRVISLSGGASDFVAQRGDACQVSAETIGKGVGCGSFKSSSGLIKCLRKRPAAEITKARNLVNQMGPCIDGDFFPVDIENLLSSSHTGQYDLLMGVNSGDGSYFGTNKNGISAKKFRDEVKILFEDSCRLKNVDELTDATLDFYTNGNLKDPKANQRAFTQMGGDVLFFAPTCSSLHSQYQAARSSKYGTSTYFYYFQYATEKSEFYEGASHGGTNKFVFGKVAVPRAARDLSSKMMAYWTNFAKTGNPNADDLPVWPKWTPDTEEYIILDSTISTGQRLAEDRMTFWRDYLPSLYQFSDSNTCH